MAWESVSEFFSEGQYRANFRPRKLPNAIGRTAKNRLINSVWAGAASGTPGTAPTGWSLSAGGTTTVYPSSFLGGNALGFSASSNRHYISGATATITPGTFCFSVHVTTVVGVAPNQILLVIANTITPTVVGYYFDGVAINASAALANGISGVLSVVYTVSATGLVTVRAGIGTSSNATGEVILDLPQFEAGSTRTDYEPTYGQLPPYFLRNSDGTDTSVKGILSTKGTDPALFDSGGINQPCFDGKDGLILEAQATNLHINSVFGGVSGNLPANWVNGFGGATNRYFEASPDFPGLTQAVFENNNSTRNFIYQNVALTANTTYSWTAVIEVISQDDVTIRGQIFNITGLPSGASATFSVNGGGDTNIPLGINVVTCRIVIGATAGTPLFRLGIGVASNTTNQVVAIRHPQLEVGSFPTSYIPTTTAAVTRNAAYIGNIPLSELGLVSKTNDYSFHVAYKVPFAGNQAGIANGTIFGLRPTSSEANRLVVFYEFPNIKINKRVNNTNQIFVSAAAWASGDILNIRGRVTGAGTRLIVNSTTTDATTGNHLIPFSEPLGQMTLNVFPHNLSQFGYGAYLGFQVWDRALSDAELEALSADAFRFPSGGRSLVNSVLTPVLKPALIPALTE
jgi:hypothetical protein